MFEFSFRHAAIAVPFLFFSMITQAQESTAAPDRNQLFALAEIGYARGVGNADVRDKREVSIPYHGNLFRGRLVTGILVNSKNSFGVGIAFDALRSPDFKCVPVTFDYRHYWKENNGPFLAVMAGYSIKVSKSYSQGIYSSVNVGYSLGKRRAYLFSVGFDFHQMYHVKSNYYYPPEGIVYIESSVWLKAISFNVALRFSREEAKARRKRK